MPKRLEKCKKCQLEAPRDQLHHAPYHDVYLCNPCFEASPEYVYAHVDGRTSVMCPIDQCLSAVIGEELHYFHGTKITLARFFGLHQEPDGQWYFYEDENGKPIRDVDFVDKIYADRDDELSSSKGEADDGFKLNVD